ncbi:hypothetical protein [Vibrio gigantis]|uniref:hypothetical protein n=1 Tax=Vibrio gigantis TaxID=296199 RepID=UPI001BFDBC3E|nr:hypothetical protein [Vibrio gigantis]
MSRLYISLFFLAIGISFTLPVFSSELISLSKKINKLKSNVLSSQESSIPSFIYYLPKKASRLDNNGNWVRDDIEIYISYRFIFEPSKRAAFIQMTNILDRIATDGHQSNDARQVTLWIEENAAMRCFYDQGFNGDDVEELKSYVLDKESKVRSYNEVVSYRTNLDPRYIFIVRHNLERCDQMLLENQITIQSI